MVREEGAGGRCGRKVREEGCGRKVREVREEGRWV